MPREYYCLLPHEFSSMVKGFNKRIYSLSSEKRLAAYISILPHTKDLNYGRFCREMWPLSMDEVEEEVHFDPVPDKETWESIKKQLSPRKEKTEFERILQLHNIKDHG